MIEKLLDEVVKPFEALLTKPRCMAFLSFVFFLSPDFFGCVDLVLSGSSVSKAAEAVGAAFLGVDLWSFVFLLLLFFYISPKLVFRASSALSDFQLKKRAGEIDKLMELSRRDDEYFIYSYFEINGKWREDRDVAEGDIRYRIGFLEISFSLSVFCVYCYYLNGASLIVPIMLLLSVVLYGFEASLKNVSCYLSDIAPYKIAINKIKDLNGGL